MLLTLVLAALPLADPHPLLVPPPAATPGADPSEAVRIETEDHVTLAATYYEPTGKEGRSPAAMLIHDAGCDQNQVVDIAKYLQRKGFGVLTVDLRGHGGSVSEKAGAPPWEALDERSRERAWAFAMRDLRAGADFLRKRREIHASNLSIVGIGASAALAVRHAMDDENARAVVLISPRAENFGFNLVGGLGHLEGLPSLIISPKDGREAAARLQNAGHKANDGYEYIELAVMKSEEGELLSDSRLRAQIATWLRDKVVTKRN